VYDEEITMSWDITSTVRLNNGVEIPRLGLGVYQTPAGGTAEQAVTSALEVGYRHVDTAMIYGNEASVGRAVRANGIDRSEVFVTSKLWNSDHGYDRALKACEQSLQRLGLDHVDLYLIHWPVQDLRRDSWRALETLLEEGRCRAIGVSNYMPWHIEELLAHCSVKPAVNQIEFSPFLYQADLLDLCHRHHIRIEAYSPLTKGHRLDDPTLTEVAARHDRTVAQVLIRWALQHDTVVLPKSQRPERIAENADVFGFSLTDSEMRTLDALNEGFRTSWDPSKEP